MRVFVSEVFGLGEGSRVVVAGWCENVRVLGGLVFIKLRDRSGYLQVVVKKGDSPELFERVKELPVESVVKVSGVVKRSVEAPGGVELVPVDLVVVSVSEQPVPLNISGKVVSDLSKRLDWRFLDLRLHKNLSVFKVQSTIVNCFRNHFLNLGFLEIQPPGIIKAASEGGAELFSVDYFGDIAFLAQSPQLYKQMVMAAGFDRVFMTVPVWRAEPHNTVRHLNEARQCDIEVSWVDWSGAVKFFEGVAREVVRVVKKRNKEDLELLGVELKRPKFVRLSYDEVLDELRGVGVKLEWGEDLSSDAEKKLGELFGSGVFVVVHHYPTKVRAFYSKPTEGREEVCDSYDVIFNGVEILSGAVRISDFNELVRALESRGLNPFEFKFYTDIFRFGCPPHAGWSFGLERFTMTLLGLSNIREAALFPRDRTRLTP